MNELFPQPSVNTANIAVSTFKLVGEAPEASFVRKFTSLKALRQFKTRNSAIKATSYIFHENQWERFVIYGSKVIPQSVLQSMLDSLNSSNS
jgi:hypothetical protein